MMTVSSNYLASLGTVLSTSVFWFCLTNRVAADEWSGDQVSAWVRSDRFPKESHNPDEKEAARLKIKWNQPRVGDLKFRERHGDIKAKLKETSESSSFTVIELSGTILVESPDGKSSKPIDWLQGVRVAIATSPKARPNWGKGFPRFKSTWSDFVIETNGNFVVLVDPSDINRLVGNTAEFQVGLSLGKKSGQRITWYDSAPALPQSITMLPIPGPKPLSATLTFVNDSPSISGLDAFDPTKLVRAVNHLHGLGKDKAVSELRKFLNMTNGLNPFVRRDPANIDTAQPNSLFLITNLLFEDKDSKNPRPGIRIGQIIVPGEKDKDHWPYFPLGLQDDIPFLINGPIVLGGAPTPPHVHLDWAEKHGVLRAKSLQPANDPLATADKFLAHAWVKRIDVVSGDIRQQAWQSISEVPNLPKKPSFYREDVWQEFKKSAASLKIRWSVEQQKYVAGK